MTKTSKNELLSLDNVFLGIVTILVLAVLSVSFYLTNPYVQWQKRQDEKTLHKMQMVLAAGNDGYNMFNYEEIIAQVNKIKESAVKNDIEFKKIHDDVFELCATFYLSNKSDHKARIWHSDFEHDAGYQCLRFEPDSEGIFILAKPLT